MSGMGDNPVSSYVKFLLVLLLVGLAGNQVGIHGDESQPAYGHILYLVDTSYSMGVTMPGKLLSQADISRAVIAESLKHHAKDGTAAGPRFALATFSGPDSFTVQVPFTVNPGRITAALPDLEYWDTTDMESALEAAKRFMRRQAAGFSKIILVSDGVQTDDTLYSLPVWRGSEPDGAAGAEIHLEVLPLPLPFNRPAGERWLQWISSNRAKGADRTEVTRLNGEDSSLLSPPIVYTGSSEVLVEAEGYGTGGCTAILEKIDLLFSPLAFILFLCLLLISVAAVYLTHHRKDGDLPLEYRSRYFIHYRVKTSAAVREDVREMRSSRDGDLLFPIGRSSLRISIKDDHMDISSRQPVLIDGVAARHRKIHPGSRIVAGGSYYTILKIEELREAADADVHTSRLKKRLTEFLPDVHTVSASLLLVPSGVAAVLFILLLSSIHLVEVQAPAGVQRVERRIELQSYDWISDFKGGKEQDDFSPESPPLIIQGQKRPEGWEFEGAPPPGEVDLLCIHSHPDDESIDFGGLLARASMEGKTSAVVLCTDGESGLSRGPSRTGSSGGAVPLKETRIAEARTAMAWLGVDYYIRLGFRNHPYSSQLQVLPIEEVYADWGGYVNVKSALKTLIRQMEPRVIAAPDGPSPAREHFEHDAAGFAAAEAVRELTEETGYRPESFVTSIDPLQKDLFPAAGGTEVLEPSASGWPSPRMIQHQALRAHESQIDARIIALEYISLFQYEYYLNGAE